MSSYQYNRRAFLRGAAVAGIAAVAGGISPLSLAHAGNRAEPLQETHLLMGTMVTLAAHDSEKDRLQAAFGAAVNEMQRLIAIFDRHNGATALGTLNSHGSLQSAPKELVALMGRAISMATLTEGLFNPAVQPLVNLLASSRTNSLRASVNTAEWHEAMALATPTAITVSPTKLQFARSGMAVTLDGIAKGFIADAAGAVLRAHGVHNFIVNAGGDICVQGTSPKGSAWRIGIENPGQKGHPAEAVALTTGAVATSGGYEATFDKSGATHHLVNPLTGASPQVAGASVVAPTTELADALATACCLMPPAQSVALCNATNGVECLVYTSAGQRVTSAGWQPAAV